MRPRGCSGAVPVHTQAAVKEAALASMRKVVARAEATGATNAGALAAVSSQMAELRESYLGWQQTVLAGRLVNLKADSQRIAENDRLKVRPQASSPPPPIHLVVSVDIFPSKYCSPSDEA